MKGWPNAKENYIEKFKSMLLSKISLVLPLANGIQLLANQRIGLTIPCIDFFLRKSLLFLSFHIDAVQPKAQPLDRVGGG